MLYRGLFFFYLEREHFSVNIHFSHTAADVAIHVQIMQLRSPIGFTTLQINNALNVSRLYKIKITKEAYTKT